MLGRTPHGVRGLKLSVVLVFDLPKWRRTPHGVRGLKFLTQGHANLYVDVAPHTGCVD